MRKILAACTGGLSAAVCLGSIGLGLWSYRAEKSVGWDGQRVPAVVPAVARVPETQWLADWCDPGPPPHVSNRFYAAGGRIGFQRFRPAFVPHRGLPFT